MSKLRFRISMSLDGYVAGPNQSVNVGGPSRSLGCDEPVEGLVGEEPAISPGHCTPTRNSAPPRPFGMTEVDKSQRSMRLFGCV